MADFAKRRTFVQCQLSRNDKIATWDETPLSFLETFAFHEHYYIHLQWLAALAMRFALFIFPGEFRCVTSPKIPGALLSLGANPLKRVYDLRCTNSFNLTTFGKAVGRAVVLLLAFSHVPRVSSTTDYCSAECLALVAGVVSFGLARRREIATKDVQIGKAAKWFCRVIEFSVFGENTRSWIVVWVVVLYFV